MCVKIAKFVLSKNEIRQLFNLGKNGLAVKLKYVRINVFIKAYT